VSNLPPGILSVTIRNLFHRWTVETVRGGGGIDAPVRVGAPYQHVVEQWSPAAQLRRKQLRQWEYPQHLVQPRRQRAEAQRLRERERERVSGSCVRLRRVSCA
jgi:hypothetical protein